MWELLDIGLPLIGGFISYWAGVLVGRSQIRMEAINLSLTCTKMISWVVRERVRME